MKIKSILAACFAAMALTSCLDNDDNVTYQVLTDAQKRTQMMDATGNYSGWAYINNQSTSKLDSAAVTWKLNYGDSSLVVNDFPYALLSKLLTNTKDIETVAALSSNPYKTMIMPYYIGTESYYAFNTMPLRQSETFTATSDTANSEVKISFANMLYAANNSMVILTPRAAYKVSDGMMQFYVLIDQVVVNKTVYSLGAPILVSGYKKIAM